MIYAASAELVANFLSCSETKICNGHTEAIVEAKHVLGFQIPMINTQSVAIVNCVEQLKENILDESVVSKIATAMENLREQIVVWCVVHDDVGVVEVLHDAVEGDNARVSGCDLMQSDLADMNLPLSRRLVSRSNQAFDSV